LKIASVILGLLNLQTENFDFIYQEFLASATSTATATPQIRNLIGRTTNNVLAARAARTLEQSRPVLSRTTT